MGGKAKKRPLEAVEASAPEVAEVPLTRGSEDDPPAKKGKWTNKNRVLVFAARGINFRGRHLLSDLMNMMPHSKTESKMQKRESLFAINEVAEMKNCGKCLLFEGRRKRDLYLWAANIARGPSVKFEVENIHTMAELKMTGNCLKSSRPLLSFDKSFTADPHLSVIKELLTQIFGVPNHHPKSQPFFDHVFTFSVVDGKIWFRNYQILEETGSLAEIGPRMVLNPIKVFEGSFCGQTLWENPKYVTPTAKRAMLKKMKANKYEDRVQSKAAYEASRPTDSTYKVDKTDEVFNTMEEEEDEDEEEGKPNNAIKFDKKKKKKSKKKQAVASPTAENEED